MRSRQFVHFLLAGGIAAGVNFSSRILYSDWVSFSWAIVLAYLSGMITAFLLNKRFVFADAAHPLHHQVFYFTLINLLALAQTWLVSMGLVRWGFPAIGWEWYPHACAHAIGVMVPVFSSFIGHKHLSFRSHT